jgi:hypothetical protein
MQRAKPEPINRRSCGLMVISPMSLGVHTGPAAIKRGAGEDRCVQAGGGDDRSEESGGFLLGRPSQPHRPSRRLRPRGGGAEHDAPLGLRPRRRACAMR